jgi:hypothetical protein
MIRLRLLVPSAAIALSIACAKETSETAVRPVPPPLPQAEAAPADAAPVSADDSATPSTSSSASPPLSSTAGPPLAAQFLELSGKATKVEAGKCDTVFLSVARGKASALGESLGQGDVLMVRNPDAIDIKGAGLVLQAIVTHACPGAERIGPASALVIRASAAPELAWAGGKMRAHLDVERSVSPDVYVGRLQGTAPVAEHAHDSSWEILCAVEASGTLTLDGKPNHVDPRSVVAVPPTVKHSWQPDPGSKLVAIQFYVPPGPEQRFRALAAAAASDGGRRP